MEHRLAPVLLPGIAFFQENLLVMKFWVLLAACSCCEPIRWVCVCVCVCRDLSAGVQLGASTLLMLQGLWLQGPAAVVFRGAAGM